MRRTIEPSLKYVWFDFHGECKKMKWENLSKLVKIVKEDMDGYGHFMCDLKHGFEYRNEFNSAQNAHIIQR